MKKSLNSSKYKDKSKFEDSVDMDPYSTSIIDQLLNSTSQWKAQDEIVKLTFKAMKDFIDLHSNQIKDLKALITTRASKQEVSTGLALKANVSDLTKVIEEISRNLDSKIAYGDLNAILGEYARKKQLNELLMLNSIKNEDESNKLTDKNLQIKVIQARFEDLQKQVCKRIGGCATLTQFQQLIKIVEQKVNISELNDVLQNRVTKQYLSTCLQKKISKPDFQTALAKKADVNDLQLIINSLEMKASLPTIEKLTQIIENKADRSDFLLLSSQKKLMYEQNNQRIAHVKQILQNKLLHIQKQLESSRSSVHEAVKLLQKDNEVYLRNFITSNEMTVATSQIKLDFNSKLDKLDHAIVEMGKNVASNLSYDSFKRELMNQINLRKRCEEKIYEEIDDVRKRIEQFSTKKLEKTEFFNFKSQLAEELDQKIETEHVQEAFNKWELQLTQKTDQDKQQLYQFIKRVQQSMSDTIAQSTKQVSTTLMTSFKPEKLDHSVVEEIVRKNRREIDECRKTVDAVYGEMKGKLDIAEYEADLLEIRKKFDIVDREVGIKANIKDVCVLADSKPNIQDVNKALKQVKSALDTKTCEADLQEVVKDQSTINQTLLCQNIIGRWLWQSGQIKAGGLVPWQVQFANTVPDYYFWEKDKSSILVLASGIYEITVCVFGRSSIPNLIINGESIVGKDSENMNPLNNSKKQIMKRKKDKQSLGQKIVQFVMLPARSRICVVVPFEGAQGFLNVKRL